MSQEPTSGRVFRVRAVQVSYDDAESVTDRVRRVADLVREQRGADLIVLPELWAPGYFSFSEWVSRAELLDGPTVSVLAEAAAEVGAFVHAGSILERAPEGGPHAGAPGSRRLWNTSIVLGRNGSRIAQYRKIHPFGFGEGEPTLIDPGTSISTAVVSHPQVPGDITVGLATCYDLRFPELFRKLTAAGATIFTIPAAWPAARREHWQVLGRARAIENQAVVIQCNTGGTHGGVTLGGNSQIISPHGDVLAQAGEGQEVLAVDIDLDELEDYRRTFPVLADRRL